MRKIQLATVLFMTVIWLGLGSTCLADCPEEPPLQHYTGGGQIVCPCFVEGEEGGSVFTAPTEHYPIEILRVGIGWGSQFGGSPQSLESAINIYAAGLPNPGAPIFSLPGPVMTDGVINEFNLEPIAGEIIINSGAFTVTLEFLNNNAGDPWAPSMVHDGNGCQAAKNVVYAIPGGWFDACVLGVTGDWVVFVVYRQADCLADVGDERILVSGVPQLHQNYPNPFNPITAISFDIPYEHSVELTVLTAAGWAVTTLVDDVLSAGAHEVLWNGRDGLGRPVPSGIYFYRIDMGAFSDTRRMLLLK